MKPTTSGFDIATPTKTFTASSTKGTTFIVMLLDKEILQGCCSHGGCMTQHDHDSSDDWDWSLLLNMYSARLFLCMGHQHTPPRRAVNHARNT
jgi:hypothetical protein